MVQPITRIENDATKAQIKAQIDTLQPTAGINDRRVAVADQLAREALQQVATNGFIVDRGVYVIIDGTFTDQTEPFIFQKIQTDHRDAGHPPLDLQLLGQRQAQRSLYKLHGAACAGRRRRPSGAYQTVGAASINIPGLAAAGAAGPVGTATLYKALDTADQAYSAAVNVDLGTDYGLLVESGDPLDVPIYVDATLDALEVAVFYDDVVAAAEAYLYDPEGADAGAPSCEYDGVESLCYFNIDEPAGRHVGTGGRSRGHAGRGRVLGHRL